VLAATPCPLFEVDTHNVVPCFVASPRREYAAATFRAQDPQAPAGIPGPLPGPARLPDANLSCCPPVNWSAVRAAIGPTPPWPRLPHPAPGATAAHKALERFVRERLPIYAEHRNDPTVAATSELSALFPLRPTRAPAGGPDRAPRRGSRPRPGPTPFWRNVSFAGSLADQFSATTNQPTTVLPPCPAGPARPWPPMPPIPRPLPSTISWTSRPESPTARCGTRPSASSSTPDASTAICACTGRKNPRMVVRARGPPWTRPCTFNDRYALDGRDPNGVVGVLWSVGGLPTGPGPIGRSTAQVRYMNERGCRRKIRRGRLYRPFSGACRMTVGNRKNWGSACWPCWSRPISGSAWTTA